MEYNFERSLDELGRVVLPVDGRRALALREGDILSVQVDPPATDPDFKKADPLLPDLPGYGKPQAPPKPHLAVQGVHQQPEQMTRYPLGYGSFLI